METLLDSFDVRILNLLQHDAQLTAKEIGDNIRKSPSAVGERINKLKASGVIRKYVVLVDKTMVAKSLIAFTNFQLKEHAQKALDAFQKEVCKFPEVMECYHLAGVSDFLLKIAMEDMGEYYLFLQSKLATLPNIGNVQTQFVLNESKLETAYELAAGIAKLKK